MALFRLSEEAWAATGGHLPKNQPGARQVDDRRVIHGIVNMLKVGCRWGEPSRLRTLHVGLEPVQPVIAPWLLAQAAGRAGRVRYLLADKGCDADRLRRSLCDAGAAPVIAARRNCKRIACTYRSSKSKTVIYDGPYGTIVWLFR